MNRRLIRYIPLMAMLILSGMIATGMFNKSETFETPSMVGLDIVPFNVPTLGSKEPRFAPRDWKGKVIVFNVFASWCKPCIEEHKVWMKLAQSGKATIYGMAWKDTPEKVSAWLNQYGNPYQLIGIDETGSTTIALALTGVPETFILGPTGNIFYHTQSPVTEDMVNTIIVPMVEKITNGELQAPKRITDVDPITYVATPPVAEALEQPQKMRSEVPPGQPVDAAPPAPSQGEPPANAQ